MKEPEQEWGAVEIFAAFVLALTLAFGLAVFIGLFAGVVVRAFEAVQ